MRKKILAFVFASALLVGTAIPALAAGPPGFVGKPPPTTPPSSCDDALNVADDHADVLLGESCPPSLP